MVSGAANHRHTSVQDVETPADLLDAVAARYGSMQVDLAATAANAKAPVWLGPGGLVEDTFSLHWQSSSLPPGNRWLNPPFGDIAPWVARCRASWSTTCPIFLLCPSSVDSNWWADHVHAAARVHFLRPRVKFVGHEQPFPKGLALCAYGLPPGYECWQWKDRKR
jgi:DNA N-6-adenine-methyltransferase (Dam)